MRRWWRKSHSKIKADDEFGLAMQRKGSERACLHTIRKPGENEIWKSNTSELVEWAATKNRETRSGILTKSGLFKSGNLVNCWKQERGDPWWNENADADHVRTGRLVYEQPPCFFTQHTDKFVIDDDDMDSDTAAESEMSLKSRSFLHSMNDRVRKMQDQSSKMQHKTATNILWYCECFFSTLQASVFMGKNHSENLHSIKNTGNNLAMKQMFDISGKLIVGQSDEIYGVNTINWWEVLHGNIYLWLAMKKSLVSRTQRFAYFQILCFALERCTRTHNQILSGKPSWCGSRVHHNTELWTQLMVSQWNSSGIFSQDSPHCSSATKSKSSCQKWA